MPFSNRRPTSWRSFAAFALLAVSVSACGSATPPAPPQNPRDIRERAYRQNNLGVALLEQLSYADAAAAFRNAVAIDPQLAVGRLNLAIALLYEQDLDGAATEATEAAKQLSNIPQPAYVLGLIARAQNRNPDARAFFEKVRQIDATDVGTNVNLAQIALEDRRYDEAITLLEPIVRAEPMHVTASYVLGLALTRGNRQADGEQLLARAQSLRRAAYAVTFGTGYLEQGRYAEAIASTGNEPDLVDASPSTAAFTPSALIAASGATVSSPFANTYTAGTMDASAARTLAAGLGGAALPIDIDGDGTLELIVVSQAGQQLLRRAAGGSWADAIAGSGLETAPRDAVPTGAISADFDNDGSPDLFVLRDGTSSLYKNDGKGHFTDVTRSAGITPYTGLASTAAFVDVDHDGDVDLVMGGLADVASTRRAAQSANLAFPAGFAPAALRLLRNNGNSTFTDITRQAGLESREHAVAIVPTDFDNRRDIDLLVISADTAPKLFANQRDGTFKDVARDVGLADIAVTGERVTAVATGDVNKDDWPDFVVATTGTSRLALSTGRGRFEVVAAPDGLRGATSVQFADVDSDGLLDLVGVTGTGLTVFRNLGQSWSDVSSTAVPTGRGATANSRLMAVADLDGDGRTDLLTAGLDGSVHLWRNSGDPRNQSLAVRLRGRVSNRAGIGSKVQVRAGSLSARFEVSSATPPVASADLIVGLGQRPGAEVVRVLWPSGILQAETSALPTASGPADGSAPAPSNGAGAPAAGASATAIAEGKGGAAAASGQSATATLKSPFTVEELDRKPSSCPFLFTWNGERFEFITDFLGGGEMGYREGPGLYNHPDPVEYVRIRADQLKPSNGQYELRVTNELEEVLYLDHLQLTMATHPSDVELYPNEGMTVRPKPFRMHAVRRPHVPARVTDDHGHDVTERIANLDRRYPDDFALERIRGYAKTHSLLIDTGADASRHTLLLTAWTDYAFSSDNVAAEQAGLALIEPVLEVRGGDGRWRKLDVGIGIPVGRPQTIPIDLTGLLRPDERQLRLTTNMRIYWDQIRIGETVPAAEYVSTPTDLKTATLEARGFSAEVRPDGEDPPTYDYGRVSRQSPWKTFAGSYTREGDVLPLLEKSDDHFIIARTGDEVALTFAAPATDVPPGWTRTYFLKGDGYSKEMDINSASPDTVEPLPFHGMSRYPYPPSEHYPDTADHNRYRATFNTRGVVRGFPRP